MSSRTTGGREVAYRLFAAEFEDATYAFTRGDEERAPKYVVSPTGALINRLFVVGVVTETEQVNEETVRARIADPTGVFVVYASQYQPDARAALQELESPAFVAVTGKANTFVPDGGDRAYTSIRPEAVATVDAQTRDHWAVTTAEHTLARLGDLAAAQRDGASATEGIDIAMDEYAPTPAYTANLYNVCVGVLEMVAGDRDTVSDVSVELDASGEPTVPLADIVTTGEAMTFESPQQPQSTEEPTGAEDTSDAVEDADPVDPSPPDPDEPVVSADEREAVETEFGTEFATGDEIDSPEDPMDDVGTDEEEEEDTEEEAEVDLADRIVDLLEELDTGEGVTRDRIVDTASDRFEATPDAIEDAMRTAMMNGRCYEPAEDVLRPI